MDFDGHCGSGSVGGLTGFDGPDFDGIDSIDLLDGAEHGHAPGDHCQGPEMLNGVGVSPDGDMCAARVLGHGETHLFDLFLSVAEGVGLMKVASILVGQKALIPQRSCSILHANSCFGAKKGNMPRGYTDGMTGSTFMFRQYFQIPKREWGMFSTPVYDKEAAVYLDVAGMTWHYRDRGDFESQLLVRVVPMSLLNSATRQWCIRTDTVNAHRKAARTVATTVHSALNRCSPPAKAVEARRGNRAPVVVAAAPVVTAPVVTVATRPVRSAGADLLSALRRSPQYAALQTCAAGSIPPLATDVRPTAGEEMVSVRLNLPRRSLATV